MSENDNEATVEQSTPTFRELQEQLASVTSSKQALEERIEYNKERRDRQEARLDHDRDLLRYRNEHIHRAMNSALNHYAHDLPQFDTSHPDVAKLVQGALKVAKITGYRHDAYRAVEDLPDEITNWREIQDDESLVIEDEADKLAKIREIVFETLRGLEFHPTDPRFTEVWKGVAVSATGANLCSEFDKLAQMFGIPTDMLLDFEGYVSQSGSYYSRTFVSGTATREEILNGDIDDDIDLDNTNYEVDEIERDLNFS